MNKKLVLIESEGLLYRGPAADYPTEIWDYPRARWVPYRYYDTPPWSQPLSQAYHDTVMPEHVKKHIAEMQPKRDGS